MEPLDQIAAELRAQRHDPHADEASFGAAPRPGDSLSELPVLAHGAPGTLGAHTGGAHQLLYFVRREGRLDPDELQALHGLLQLHPPVLPLLVCQCTVTAPGFETLLDAEAALARQLDARAGTAYLLSPERRVLGRWRGLRVDDVRSLLAEAQQPGAAA